METALYRSPALRQLEAAHRHEPLMARAGAAAAAWAETLAAERERPVLILVGPGNNGGDALVVARLLRQRFFEVCVVFQADPAKLPADAANAYQEFIGAGGVTLPAIPEHTPWSLIVDGLFGIGLTRAPGGIYADWIFSANRLAQRDRCPLLALDCPSGLNADTGQRHAPCIRATHTITFIAAKPGLHTADGPDCCGQLRVADLALDPTRETPPDGACVGLRHFADWLRPRMLNSHKGTFGSAGILGGAPSMTGAALLAGRAALKLGTGRVYVGLLDAHGLTCDFQQPELMFRTADGLLQADLTALACGPGLGTSSQAGERLAQALATPLPLVLDADALNLIACVPAYRDKVASREAPSLLTPHPAEAARLLDCTVSDIQADRIAAARRLAANFRAGVVLKGCGTILALPDGRWWLNTTGNPGMASAGMGDVLTGLLVALLAQGWPLEKAMLAGVHLHGAAADRCVALGQGPAGLTASEVLDAARGLFNAWTASHG